MGKPRSQTPTLDEQVINDRAIHEIIRRSKEYPKDCFLALVKMGSTYHISGALLALGMCGKVIPNTNRIVVNREMLLRERERLEKYPEVFCDACWSQMQLEPVKRDKKYSTQGAKKR